MKLKKESMGQFDVKGIKERLLVENKYILNLWSRVPIQISSDLKEYDDLVTLKKNRPVKVLSSQRANTLEELYSKLDAIKGKKLQYKERLIKKGLKNKVDKKKRKDERRLKKTLIKGNKKPTDLKVESKPEPSKPTKPSKPVFNSEGKIVFSKFDFAESSSTGDARGKKETKDPHKLLKKIEKQKEKLKQLEEKGETERVQAIKEKEVWKTALQKAAGVKVKDDPKLLTKTLKRKQQQKKKSRKEWQTREQQVQKQMEEKQQKRKANLEERSKKRKSTKKKHMVKKGRIIPGVTS